MDILTILILSLCLIIVVAVITTATLSIISNDKKVQGMLFLQCLLIVAIALGTIAYAGLWIANNEWLAIIMWMIIATTFGYLIKIVLNRLSDLKKK